MTKTKKTLLKLYGPTIIFVDWANVYGWQKSVPYKINFRDIFQYFQKYSQVKAQHFYFGEDKHRKSKKFLERIKKVGFILHTKPVKYINVQKKPPKFMRKCDFDLEIALDAISQIKNFETFIFFSGDGDFAYLYQKLRKKEKQVIVIHHPKYLGREIWQMRGLIFLIDIRKIFPRI